MNPELEALSARLDAVECELRALALARFDVSYPPGHGERDARMPDFLKPKPKTPIDHAQEHPHQNDR